MCKSTQSEIFIEKLLDARSYCVGHCLDLRTSELSEETKPKHSGPHHTVAGNGDPETRAQSERRVTGEEVNEMPRSQDLLSRIPFPSSPPSPSCFLYTHRGQRRTSGSLPYLIPLRQHPPLDMESGL